jgi:hypothetical protein
MVRVILEARWMTKQFPADEKQLCLALGKRLAETALKLAA